MYAAKPEEGATPCLDGAGQVRNETRSIGVCWCSPVINHAVLISIDYTHSQVDWIFMGVGSVTAGEARFGGQNSFSKRFLGSCSQHHSSSPRVKNSNLQLQYDQNPWLLACIQNCLCTRMSPHRLLTSPALKRIVEGGPNCRIALQPKRGLDAKAGEMIYAGKLKRNIKNRIQYLENVIGRSETTLRGCYFPHECIC